MVYDYVVIGGIIGTLYAALKFIEELELSFPNAIQAWVVLSLLWLVVNDSIVTWYPGRVVLLLYVLMWHIDGATIGFWDAIGMWIVASLIWKVVGTSITVAARARRSM